MTQEPAAIEREIEETRDRLATTIDQLLYRSNPKTIASRETARLKAHFVDVDTGQPRTGNILTVAGGVVGVIALFVVVRKVVS